MRAQVRGQSSRLTSAAPRIWNANLRSSRSNDLVTVSVDGAESREGQKAGNSQEFHVGSSLEQRRILSKQSTEQRAFYSADH